MTDRPPKRPGTHPQGWMSDDDRANVGLQHRRSEAHAFGVPVVQTDPNIKLATSATGETNQVELTSPYDLVERGFTDDQKETSRRLQRPLDAPANIGHVIKSIDHTNKAVERLRATDAKLGDSVLKLEQSVGAEAIEKLTSQVDELTRKNATVLKLLFAVATAAGGSLIAVGKGLYERGAHEGADAVRLDHIESAVREHEQDIRRLDREPRGYTQPSSGWLVPPSTTSTKDKP